MQRQRATEARAAKYGLANQISYEAAERAKRDNLKKKLTDSHAAAVSSAAKRAAAQRVSTTGMNAGTLGGAYLASFQPKKKK